MKRFLHSKYLKILIAVIILCLIISFAISRHLKGAYENTLSNQVIDRHGEIISIEPNNKGYLVLETSAVSPQIKELLLQKEDRYFPYHPGINPVSIAKTFFAKLGIGSRDGSSTLTQQLAKLILETETKRSLINKMYESVAAVSLEIFQSKNKILTEYANSVYLGNQIQGVETASRAYFNKSSEKLSTEEIMQLLVTLNNPSYNNPLLGNNIDRAISLSKEMGVSVHEESFVSPETVRKNLSAFATKDLSFELSPWLTENIKKTKKVSVTLDITLNEKIRDSVKSLMPGLYARDAHNAAVVVLDAHTNEILALIGTPNSTSGEYGQQINMLTKPRQVASTIKPLLYSKAFEAGMRPYTLIDDKEYPYTTADGRILYPRNFDNKYHGIVSADYALANSINVPAIKTLEFLTPEKFKELMITLGYPTPEKVIEHQLGTALGTIDMTLLQLTHYYSIFPNRGELLPLKIFADNSTNSVFYPDHAKQVIDPKYTELITKILSDRYLAIDQFGYASALTLPIQSYALKTGTSDDYRDTWVVGYTPDFIVGTWVGNTDNTPTKNLSGQTGAGEIWSRVMQVMMETEYNHNTSFTFDLIEKLPFEDRDSYGLPGDDVERARNLLLNTK
ncbi:MAG: transglycosylase domain-containing protein [Patescibacteria group bacterium]